MEPAGKGAYLARKPLAELPVPQGFILKTTAYIMNGMEKPMLEGSTVLALFLN